jgi:two-component system CheB/CheR fusion protein
VVTASTDAIISFSLDGTILSWNNGAERIFGYEAADAIGKNLSILSPGEGPEHGSLISKIASAQAIESYETVRRRKDGTELHVSITVSRICDDSGKVMAGTAMVRDITAVKRAGEALLRALAENEKSRAELQAAAVAKDRFLAVLSHELRNPLASIDGAAELMLAEGAREADTHEAAAVVRRQARSMKSLLDDLLDVSRLKLGRLELHRERVRLSTIVASALETTRPMLADAGHSLTVDVPPTDVELDGDALRLGQVLSNLLVNAIRYTPRGGKLTVRGRLVDAKLELVVRDTGVGMDPERIEAMFEMFTQGEAGADTQGLGIGLALVKSLVELHGGRVSAHSEGPGCGSEFRVVLPGAVAVAAPVAAIPTRPPIAGAKAVNKRGLVLVADDNGDAGWGMAKLLEIAGFETTRVTNGEQALHAMGQRQFDAAVIDIGMPDISGHEVARRARAEEWGRRMVLVAATGWGQDSDAREATQAGFDAHLTKPVDARKLATLLDELLASARS